MREIPLTQGFIAIVDNEDYEHLMQWKWCCANNGYAVRSRHKAEAPGSSMILMHRMVLERAIGPCPEGMRTDHRDMDKLNNRRSNLRWCTRVQNHMNKGLYRNNSSGYKGVSWDRPRGKWIAQIMENYCHRHLGRFDSPEAAARAYDKAALARDPEFARLNF